MCLGAQLSFPLEREVVVQIAAKPRSTAVAPFRCVEERLDVPDTWWPAPMDNWMPRVKSNHAHLVNVAVAVGSVWVPIRPLQDGLQLPSQENGHVRQRQQEEDSIGAGVQRGRTLELAFDVTGEFVELTSHSPGGGTSSHDRY